MRHHHSFAVAEAQPGASDGELFASGRVAHAAERDGVGFPVAAATSGRDLDGDSFVFTRAFRTLARQGDVGEDDHGPARRGEGAAGAGGDAELEEFHRGGVCGARASARRRRALHNYANLVRATAPARKAATTVAMRLILSSLPARLDDEASMA